MVVATLTFLSLQTLLIASASSFDCSSIDLPVFGRDGYCARWDLSNMALLPPVNITVGTSQYTLQVCGNVMEIPPSCKGKDPSPAYAYQVNGICYTLGKLSDVVVYPVDPSKTATGIRISYNNGERDKGADWPRSVIYDLYCDPDNIGTPETVFEWPTYTYKVVWKTRFGCLKSVSKGTCSLPTLNATWDSLRFRSRPSWFENVKFGIFIHWGMFSVPSFESEWYWKRLMTGTPDYVEFHNRVYGCSGIMPDKFPCNGPKFSFPEFAPMFKAELFDPDHWAKVFKQSGAKYVVLTSKHHEGWCNFPSAQHWNWNSMNLGPKMDLVANLSASVRAQGLHMGLYHSLREWYHPLYIQDNEDNCSTTSFVDEVLHPTLIDMVTRYKPEVIWADGDGDVECTHDSIKYWKSPKFLSWLYNESPVRETVVVNSRWGDPNIGDYTTGHDRYTPGVLLDYKWESCYTIQAHSWGYDRTEDISSFYDTKALLMQLVSSVSCNGNLLLNIGPMADGTIDPVFEERLLEMGAWLDINGEAIYDTVPWKVQNDSAAGDIWYTANKDGVTVYAIMFRAPTLGQDIILEHSRPTLKTRVTLLGEDLDLNWDSASDGFHVTLQTTNSFPSLQKMKAWTLKMTYMSSWNV